MKIPLKKNLKIILFLLSFFLFLTLTACSRVIDLIWNSERASFNLSAHSLANKKIAIQIPSSSHNNVRTEEDQKKGDYFWGYYVYRNNSSPYDPFSLVGIKKQVQLLGGLFFNYVDMPGNLPDDGTNVYIDSCPVAGVTYYYRVTAVFRKFSEDEEWIDDLTNKSSSSWVAATCQY